LGHFVKCLQLKISSEHFWGHYVKCFQLKISSEDVLDIM
jgi:hypothetical protein